MFDPILLEILSHPTDQAASIVTQGVDGPHLVNTWNSYITAYGSDQLLIPAGRFTVTEHNLNHDRRVTLSIAHREVTGMRYPGTGVIITGTASFAFSGPAFERIQSRFSWARAALVVTILSTEQTL
jgi:hypothetical protein